METEDSEDALAQAVIDFVRAIRNDSRMEEFSADSRRRRKLVAELARETAALHGVGADDLASAAALMISGKDPDPVAKP